MQIILPLLALPWLARVLGPDAFGLLMYMCLFPPLVALFVDWGLSLGGSRKATALREREQDLGTLFGTVLAARLLLILACLVICLFCVNFLPHCMEYPAAFGLAVWAGLARGLNPLWFFQGAGYGMAPLAMLDVGASLVALAGVVLLIHAPSQWPVYLLLLAATKTMAYGFVYGKLWWRYHYNLDFRAAKPLLSETSALFGATFAQMVCFNGSQLVLGWFLSAQAMGFLVAAAKMLKALVSLVNPFSQTLFPEICIWQRQKPADARKILRISLGATAGCAFFAALVTAALAPWLIQIALGATYAQAVPVLRLMLLAVPFMACNNVLAQQILTPYGREKYQFLVLARVACAALPLAALLGFGLELAGGAILPACLEALISLGYISVIYRHCKEALWQSPA